MKLSKHRKKNSREAESEHLLFYQLEET